MITTNIKRVIRSGFFNFARNGFVSLSSVFVMFVTLSVIGSLMLTSAVLHSTLDELRDKVDLNVYFVPKTAESDILNIKKSLEGLAEVERVNYVSQEQALAEFQVRHENDQLTLQALAELEENPLGAVLNVKTKEPSQYQGVAEFLQGRNILGSGGTTIVDKVNYYQNKNAIDKLSNFISTSQKLGLALTILLVAISILITFNTLRLVIYVSREEIAVMKLVGASNFYVRGPFVITSILYGLISGILTMLVFYPVLFWLGRYTENFFGGFNLFSYYTSNFGQLFLVVVGSGIIIGAISSYLAVHKYLNT
ncbi:MAG TPA: permease-like cell division protein FtsX [Candidatus Nanoarchaeia archaeon]|nr:permease-like cell division protein FtsX [Candidatus Nanoarchaeia archaeon]